MRRTDKEYFGGPGTGAPSFRVWWAVVLAGLLSGSGCPPKEPPSEFETPIGIGTNDFLDKNDFSGFYEPRHSNAIFGGESEFEGRVVFSNLPRTVVDDVLPSDLRLAKNNNTSMMSQHPIVLVFGHQTNTAWVLPSGTPSIGSDYTEIILIIPFVQKTAKSRWHNYIVRTYLDDRAAEFIGNANFGYWKQFAAFQETSTVSDTVFKVVQSAVDKFNATSTLAGPWINNATALTTVDNYQDAMEIFAMPMLGTFEFIPGQPYVCSYFEWDLSNTEVKEITTQFQFLQPFRVSGMADWVAQGTISNVPKGAFELRDVEWRVGYPGWACLF